MRVKPWILVAVVLPISVGVSSRVSAADPARLQRSLRLDKEQPWLKADEFKVTTVGGAPLLAIRYSNEHKDRAAEELTPLGKGTARDNLGHLYEGFSQGMPETLEANRFSTMNYRFLPKSITEAHEVLFVSNPLGERAIYVEMELKKRKWEIVDYGIWKKNKAYSEQNDWVKERKKENPYRDAAAVVRVWRDNSGGFSVRASFVEFKIDKRTGEAIIQLKRADNKRVIDVPNTKLSVADQQYVRALKKTKRDQIAKDKEDNNPQLKMKKYFQAQREERRNKRKNDDDDDDDDDE